MMKHIPKLLMGIFFITTYGYGQPTFTEHVISTSADGAWSVYAADVDGDGDMDVLYASSRDDKIAWYEQEGSVSIIEDVIPLTYSLYNAYPNPFNPVTTLSYDLPEDGIVNITIYDIVGRQIKALLNSPQTAGHRSIQWNATNNAGQQVPAGVYLYSIETANFRQTKKMVLLK